MSSEQHVLQISSNNCKNGLYLVFTVQCHSVRTLLQVPRGVDGTVVCLGFLPLRTVAQQRGAALDTAPASLLQDAVPAAHLSFQGGCLQALWHLPMMSVHPPSQRVGHVSIQVYTQEKRGRGQLKVLVVLTSFCAGCGSLIMSMGFL